MTLQDKVYKNIYDAIRNNTFKVGEIYSVTKLAKSMNVSRTPFKDALARLEHDKLVEIIPSKGFKLYEITIKDIKEINQMRKAIEGYCAFELIQKKSTTKKICNELSQIIEKQEELQNEEKLNVKEFVYLDMKFHSTIVKESNNESFINIFDLYYHNMATLAQYSLSLWNRPKETIKEHKNIVNSILIRDINGCMQAIFEHMDASMKINEKQWVAYSSRKEC